MAAQPKTQQAKALVNRTLSKEQLLDMVASGWTQQKIADHVTQLTGHPISQYYICKTLQSFGEDYQEAKKAQAALHAGRIAEIAEMAEQGKIDAASARVASDNRKWVASKLDPSTYGDKVAMDIAVTNVNELHLNAMRERMRDVTPKD